MAKYRRNREKSREKRQFLINLDQAQNQKKVSQNHNFEDKIKIFKAPKIQHIFRFFFSSIYFFGRKYQTFIFSRKINATKMQ